MHIILLRGLGREAGHWGEFLKKLEVMIAAEFTLNSIDFPGCGTLFTAPACRSIAAMTEHARSTHQAAMQLEQKQTEQKVVLIGISMGAMVALDWAQRYPTEVENLIMINSSLGQHPFYWRLRLSALPNALMALFCPMPLRERLILRLVSNEIDPRIFKNHLQQWRAIQKQHPVKWRNLITMLSCAGRFKEQNECDVKGFIIASKNDKLASVKCSEDIAQKFNWPIAYHETAGHDLPLDAPDWLGETITAWLKS